MADWICAFEAAVMFALFKLKYLRAPRSQVIFNSNCTSSNPLFAPTDPVSLVIKIWLGWLASDLLTSEPAVWQFGSISGQQWAGQCA